MELALGKMQIRPDDFWSMSFEEFMRAIQGFSEFYSNESTPSMSKDELNDLMERYPD